MEKVRVYWNLHKHTWSIQSCKTNRVIDYKQYLTLRDGYFVVRESGQKRVRQSVKAWDGIDAYEKGSKNVHAFAVGYIYDKGGISIKAKPDVDWDRVKYNPHTDDYFMHQGMGANQWKPNEWNEMPRDWVGWIRMETLDNNHGRYPRVYI